MTQINGNHIVLIDNQEDAEREMAMIGVSSGGISCMQEKAQFCCIKLKDISCKSANILKQEMLSRGGEAAISATSVYAAGHTDILLMGTHLQMRYLAEKLRRQPLGLKQVALTIDAVLAAKMCREHLIKFANGKDLILQDNKTKVMGIVNVTPDSFSDGGRYFTPQTAIKKACQLVEEGADIIDIGAVSTKPGSVFPDVFEEEKRLFPVIDVLAKENVLISVDTFRAEVAQKCLERGANMINDIGGFKMDRNLPNVIAKEKCPIVLTHNRLQINQNPYTDLLSDVIQELKESLNIGFAAGVAAEQIILDPGIGFGKTASENRILLKNIGVFKTVGFPILVGLSRKSFIKDTFQDLEPKDRDDASLTAGLVAAMNGAHILRTHEVKKTVQAIKMLDAIRNEQG